MADDLAEASQPEQPGGTDAPAARGGSDAVVSAGLVTIGLLGQASDYSDWFSPSMLAILAFLGVIGFMTQLRVLNVGQEDMMYVVAMNRLRSGYVDLDPEVEEYFLAATTDDEAGVDQTYSFIARRSTSNHLFGCSSERSWCPRSARSAWRSRPVPWPASPGPWGRCGSVTSATGTPGGATGRVGPRPRRRPSCRTRRGRDAPAPSDG